MKVLVIGGGGREHTIVWKLSQSSRVDKIYCTPGNAGISEIAECIDIDIRDFSALTDFVRYEWIDLTVVGPEEPLVKGIVDRFEKEELSIFGPNSSAAKLEGSKVFAKDFMKRYNIPTAEYRSFSSYLQADEYVKLKGVPLVIKADGLAAGKGVFIAKTTNEAISSLRLIMKDKIFGASAGEKVVVEDYLEGEEVSFMVFTDGESVKPMLSAQDYKRVFDNDEGPNTGGMGAYSPTPIVTEELKDKIMNKIIYPTIRGLKREGIIYKGVLYAGLMISDGEPYVLEFNCRFGDPETQVVLPLLKSDLVDIMRATVEGRLRNVDINWHSGAALCVIMASKGYPKKYETGKVIHGLEEVKKLKDVYVFHAGTKIENGNIVTSGGRVLGITALGDDIKDAKDKAYSAVSMISWDGLHYRKDIGYQALRGEYGA